MLLSTDVGLPFKLLPQSYTRINSIDIEVVDEQPLLHHFTLIVSINKDPTFIFVWIWQDKQIKN